MFRKQILSVQNQTTNIGVLLELGRILLDIYASKFSIKNWERIKGKNSNDLLLSSYNDAVNETLTWISNIKTLKEQSKLRTYAFLKTEIGFEKYLIEIKNPALRTEITKFRLSNHSLMIETGRYKNIPK